MPIGPTVTRPLHAPCTRSVAILAGGPGPLSLFFVFVFARPPAPWEVPAAYLPRNQKHSARHGSSGARDGAGERQQAALLLPIRACLIQGPTSSDFNAMLFSVSVSVGDRILIGVILGSRRVVGTAEPRAETFGVNCGNARKSRFLRRPLASVL